MRAMPRAMRVTRSLLLQKPFGHPAGPESQTSRAPTPSKRVTCEEIHAVEGFSLGDKKKTKMRKTGASTCAAPERIVGVGTPSEQPRTYRTAGGQILKEAGRAKVDLTCDDGKSLRANFCVMDVTRPLASVSQMTKHRSLVVFRPEEDGGSYFWAPDGSVKSLECRNGVDILPCWIDSPMGFRGQSREA